MLKKYINIIYIVAITLSVCFPVTSFALDEANLTISPENPTPFTPVTVTLVSYEFNVNTVMITWSVNGKTVLKGMGEKKLTVQTGESGTQLSVHASIVKANSDKVELDIAVIPESVDILYETPESYVPLFYEGHSLPGEGASVKFIAMPNLSERGQKIPSSSISYAWYINNRFIDESSGINKQVANLNLNMLSPYTTIKVVASGPSGVTAEKSIDIYPHKVLPLLYSYDDILGTNLASLISKRYETTKEFTLSLEPFYLSSKDSMADFVSYSWILDGLPVTPLGGTLLLMRPKENSYGSKQLSISIENTKRALQKVDTYLNVIFDTR